MVLLDDIDETLAPMEILTGTHTIENILKSIL